MFCGRAVVLRGDWNHVGEWSFCLVVVLRKINTFIKIFYRVSRSCLQKSSIIMFLPSLSPISSGKEPWVRLCPFPDEIGPLSERIVGRTTHLRTWPGSARLVDFLERSDYVSGMATSGEPQRILELGSGTGWLGLTLARNLPEGTVVTLTEIGHAMPPLQRNCDGGGMAWPTTTRGGSMPHGKQVSPHSVVRCVECDWLCVENNEELFAML